MASSKGVSVKVTGLREVQLAFKSLGSEVPAKLKEKLLDAAKEVAEKIQGKVPERSGHARGSVKAQATSRSAAIAFGGSKAPYFPWLDFGGSTGKGHRSGQSGSGSVKRTFIKTGRYVYPTIIGEHDRISDAVLDAVDQTAREAGFEVRE